jgi:polyhydroxyalkanoate synthesis regulator phasin
MEEAMPKKAAKIAEIEEIEEMEDERSKLFELARKVVLAAIGAAALAQDEAEDFVNRLVERGEIAEKDARKLIREVSEKRRKKVERELDKRLENILDHMDVPSKADIDALGTKITALTHKVEGLKKTHA